MRASPPARTTTSASTNTSTSPCACVAPWFRAAAGPLESEHARAGAEGHGGRRLRGRTIDDDDELGGRRELRPQGVQARRELAPVVVRRNDDRAAYEGYRGRFHPRVTMADVEL